MQKKIAVVNITSFGREFPEHITELERKVGPVEKMLLPQTMDGASFGKRLEGFDYVLMGNYPTFDKAFFETNTTIKLIARHGIGYNNIDLEAARNAGVIATKMPNIIEVDAVAEQAVTLLLTVAKRVEIAHEMVCNDEWNTRRERIVGHQIYGATTGVVGFGNIGKRFASIMKDGFANKILVHDPYIDDAVIKEAGCIPSTLDEVLSCSDFISLHANLTNETRHLINAMNVHKIKENAILINTGRGGLVDEDAVLKALDDNVFGYGADVMESEPPKVGTPLLSHPHAIVTPHSAIYNLTCMKNMNRKVMEDVYMVERGEHPLEIIDELK